MKILTTLLLLVVASLALARTSEDVPVDHKTINEKQLKTLWNSLDTNYRPCGDFYTYACHNWSDHHKGIQYNYHGVADLLGYEVNLELMEYLEKTPETDVPRFVKLFKDFYVACRETPDFELLDFIHWMEKEENMKWALFTPDDSKDFVFDWATILARFRKYGFNYIFLTESTIYQDANSFTTYLNIPNFKEMFYPIIELEMTEYNETIPLPCGTMNFEELWQILGPFEEKLLKIKAEKQQQPTILKFQELPYPWMQNYLKALMETQVVDPNMKISIDNMAYMEALDNLLQQYDAKFLARYVEIRFFQISHMLIKSPSEHVHMSLARSLLPMSAEWIYEQLHPDLRDEIPKIEQMFENVVKNLNKSLHMDESGIIPKEFFSKLETMRMKVGYLPQENTKNLLDSYYADLQMKPNDYYHNFLKILEFYYKLEHKYFDYANFAKDKEFFYKTPKYAYNTEVKPIYVDELNLLIFPLALFRAPEYDARFEDIFKQSSLATLMGVSLFDAIATNEDFPNEYVEKISGVISLYTSFRVFFSSLSTDQIARYQQVFGFSSVRELKRMFFLNAIHYRCYRYSDVTKKFVNFAVGHLSDFAEAYDCKMNNYLKMF
ncbi:uncharacterized protein LOC109612164 [Musca domestica]|uniref:Uncharacterized protein LOC109612164 n=1 Tax=Musca domestica TaxID=7370 RepID=A0A9J7DGJ1_MUSDO|nr:uncharacterized protein LOC109612164 [Musca domestica]